MLELEQDHLASLALPALSLEVFADPVAGKTLGGCIDTLVERLPVVWAQFRKIAQTESVFERLAIDPAAQELEVELTFTANALMQTLNREYRQKDAPTDVLTFTLLADAQRPEIWQGLPVLQLGSVFISLEWAEAAIDQNPALDFESYVLERFVHGLLHLLGQHHDTMDEYERVVDIQRRVLDAAGLRGAGSGDGGEADDR